MQRSYPAYTAVVITLIAVGLPTRIVPQQVPRWSVLYGGDALWAAILFFVYCLLFKLTTKRAAIYSLISAYLIELSQLFHPPWLETLREIKIVALIIGRGFLWSDLIAYSCGIAVAAAIDCAIAKHATERNVN